MSIPYIIILAHAGYKSQHTEQKFGYENSLENVKREILTKIAKYVRMMNEAYFGGEYTIANIKSLFDGNTIPYGLEQKSWIAKAFVDEEWINVTPTFLEIQLECLANQICNKEDNEEEDNDDDKDDDDEYEEEEGLLE